MERVLVISESRLFDFRRLTSSVMKFPASYGA